MFLIIRSNNLLSFPFLAIDDSLLLLLHYLVPISSLCIMQWIFSFLYFQLNALLWSRSCHSCSNPTQTLVSNFYLLLHLIFLFLLKIRNQTASFIKIIIIISLTYRASKFRYAKFETKLLWNMNAICSVFLIRASLTYLFSHLAWRCYQFMQSLFLLLLLLFLNYGFIFF